MSPENEAVGEGEEDPQESPLSTEFAEGIPPEVSGTVGRMMSASLSMMSGVINPIAERVTSEHITEVIAFANRDSEREYDDRKHSRTLAYAFGVFVLLLIVGLIFGLVLLASEELLRYVLIGVGSFIGGLGSGVGLTALRK